MEADHVTANRAVWNEWAAWYAEAGRRAYSAEKRAAPTWGIYGVPEAEVGLISDLGGCDVVELGCGTGYVSTYCLDAGARSTVGLDNSPEQLATARALQDEFGVSYPLIWADAERVPLADNSFDVAISEYGAAIWCDPYRWIPEAARLLRPGGSLRFLGNSMAVMLCVKDYEREGPATAEMIRPQRGMHRLSFPEDDSVEFHLSHGDMIRLLRSHSFEVLDLVELYAPADATTDYPFVDAEWASQWPMEEIWMARLTG